MVETIQCPSCQTRYGLRPERVRREHRRAQCFRCGDAFHIEPEVARLLGLDEMEESPTATAQMRVIAPHHAPPPPPTQEEIEAHMGSALTLSDLTDEELSGETRAAAPAAVAAPVAPLADEGHEDGVFSSASDAISRLLGQTPAAPQAPPAFQTPVDLQSGLSALEDTLGGVMPEELSLPPVEPVSAASAALAAPISAPMAAPEPTPSPSPAETAKMDVETESGYRSAKDAMAKIFGDLPPLPSPVAGMGLGGGDAATNPGLNMDFPAAASTKRMSIEEMQKAMEAEFPQSTPPPPTPSSLPAPKPGAPAPVGATGRTTTGSFKVQMPELSPDEVTMVMPPQGVAPAAPATAPAAANPLATAPLTPMASTSGDDPNLLRLKIGDQEFKGLSLDTLIKWVEEGRVVEEHLVARQFSDNWIEAAKVPGLRPTFDRLRRARQAPIDLSTPPTMPEPAKKSLFGGLFGKKE